MKPCIGTIAGSIQINGERLSPFSMSDFPITTCRHLGSMMVFSMAFMSQDLVCEVVVSLFVLCLMFLSFVSPVGWDGCCPSLTRGKTVRAACRVGKALTSFGPLEMTASDILSFSKSIVALVFSP